MNLVRPSAAAIFAASILLSIALFGSKSAYAQPAYGTGPSWATDSEIAAELGSVHYSMIDCTEWARTVRIDISRYSAWSFDWSLSYRHAIGEVQQRAIQFAWANCPQVQASGRDPNDVDYAAVEYQGEIELAATDLQLVRRDGAVFYQWTNMRNYADSNWWRHFWDIVGEIVGTIIGIVLAMRLISNRETIARWYYFTFHPHPAEPAIRAALASGAIMDGKALAAALGTPPKGSRAFRAARAAQAETLITEMQAMTRRQMREMEARAKERYETAAVQQMQAALAEAAIALEQAKAFLKASRRT